LVYEAIYHGWIPTISFDVVDDHFYFGILRSNGVHFYDNSKQIEPFKLDRSNLEKIDRKINQISEYVSKHKSLKREIKIEIEQLFKDLKTTSFKQLTDRKKVQEKLSQADDKIKALISKVSEIQMGLAKFDKRKPFFVIERRLEELEELAEDEIEKETRQDKELLYDPKYDEYPPPLAQASMRPSPLVLY
jgi:hypothetical protein